MGINAIAENLSDIVAVVGNNAGYTNSSVDGAAIAIKPVAITDNNLSIECFVRFWEGEALSYFRRSAWEGKFHGFVRSAFVSACSLSFTSTIG
jgi:hypothetical protein